MDIGQIWDWLIVEPVAAGLQQLTALVGGGGMAIILLAALVRIIISLVQLPAQIRDDKFHALSPEISAIRAEYADDPEKRSLEIKQLLRHHGFEFYPLGLPGCLSMFAGLADLLLLIGMYSVLTDTRHAAVFEERFLWLCSLTRPDYLRNSCDPDMISQALGLPIPGPLPFLSMVTQIILLKTPHWPTKDGLPLAVRWGCAFPLPLSRFFLVSILPAGLGIYWMADTLVLIIQRFAASWGVLPRSFLFDYD